MQIAAVQHDIVWHDSVANTQRLANRIADAAQSGARLVLLSEMFATGFSMDTERVAQAPDGPIATFLATSASQHQCWVGGSFACISRDHPRPTNRFLIAGPSGEQHVYDKLHPFTYANEHLAYSPGATSCVVTIEGLRCALFVCYDLRFANEFWDLAADTDAYLVPANWPDARAHHWRSLLIARAIENQAYVVGCNRVGTAERLRYQGDSMIIDPLGRVLAQATHGETTVQAQVDAAVVADTRRQFPFLGDRSTRGHSTH